MKYENAGEILPEELLKEIQKYAAGKLLYIPSGEEKRAWGEASGYREQLQRRNRMIRNKYAHGRTISELADEYFLSLDSVKKIVYSKKQGGQAAYAPTVESAVAYANQGLLEDWMHCYWRLTRQQQASADTELLYFGVVKLPLRLIQRDEAGVAANQANKGMDDGASSPPLLIHYEQGKLYGVDQKDLLASLIQQKVNSYPAIIMLKENADYKRFMKHVGTVLFFV